MTIDDKTDAVVAKKWEQNSKLNLPKMSFTDMVLNFINSSMNDIAFLPRAFEQCCIDLEREKSTNKQTVFAESDEFVFVFRKLFYALAVSRGKKENQVKRCLLSLSLQTMIIQRESMSANRQSETQS